MKPVTCENIRDSMPELIGRRLDAAAEAVVRSHLQSCADCQVELELATAVAAARLSVPEGLHQRITAATRGRRSPAWSGRMALVASIAVAVIGGSVLLQQYLPGDEPPAASVTSVEVSEVGAGWIGVEDAFRSGAASLRDLSDEELQKLLAEIGS
jgi:hypothetical protein